MRLLVILLLLPLGLAAPGYVATFKGTFPTTRQATVTVNNHHVEVLLHNATVVAFRVPDRFLANPALLATAVVKIRVGKVVSLPLGVLKSAFVKVDIDEFRERLLDEQRNSKSRRGKNGVVGGNPEGDGDTGEGVMRGDGDEELNEDERHDGIVHELDDEIDQTFDEDVDVFEAMVDRQSEDDDTDEELDAEEDHASQKIEDESEAYPHDDWNERLADIEHHLEKKDVPKSALQTLESAVEAGSARAEVSLASLLLSGRRGLERDHSRAARLLRSAAGKGHPDAQALLGFFHASGIVPDVSRDVGAAVLMWVFAAEGGSLFAKMALGYRYFTGTDVAEDCDKAAEYYKQVADEVFNDARVDLTGRHREKRNADDPMADIRPPMPVTLLNTDRRRLSEDMPKVVMGEANERIQFYRHSADRGDADSQVVLGTLYYYGAYQMPKDVSRARKFFEAAASKGRGDAYAHLGFMDLQAGRNESAAKFLKRAAGLGDKLGLHGMGYITLHGIGVASDALKAANYFYDAARKDHPEAMYNLAIMQSRGIGVPKSMKAAHELFENAADKFGHMQSMYNLGIRFLRGISPAKKQCTQAVKYLKTVSQGGVWNKILSQAFRAYERGAYAESLYRYLIAAHAGIELAQYNAAFMYEKNLLNDPDGFTTAPKSGGQSSRPGVVEEALHLYSMSASQNSDESMVRMGNLAFGEAKDYGRAAAAYERATKLKNAEAMFNLGWMHARGFGMNPDRHMAKRYFDQAMQEDEDARLPATIAVYCLQYSEQYFDFLDKASLLMENCRRIMDGSWREERDGDGVMGSLVVTDAILLTILLGILVIVVNARQRRMVQADGDVRDGQADGDNLDHRIENNIPPTPDLQHRNREDQQQDGNRQALQEQHQ